MVSISPSLREAARRGNLFQFFWIASLTLAMTALLCAPAHAACSNPSGGAGDMIFNDDYNILQYCNGADEWIPMHPQYYWANAVEFDGTNDYLSYTSASGPTSETKWTGSFWVKLNNQDGHIIWDSRTSSDTLDIDMDFNATGDYFKIEARNSSDTTVLDLRSSAVSADEWHHIMFSIDLSDAGKRHIYIDGVSDLDNPATYNTAETMDFSGSDWGIGQTHDGSAGAQLDGQIADLWIDIGTYIDLSDADNRAKFYDATRGKPVYLGADGSLPTGSAPDIFLSGDTASWHTNKGTGGGFTENGTLDDANNSPSDHSTDTVTSGLVAHWELEESSTPSADSASSYSGTWNASPTSATGQIGNGLHFDAGDYVSIGDIPEIRNVSAVTLSAWVKRDEVNSKVQIGKQNSPPNGIDGFNIEFWNDGYIYCSVTDSSSYQYGRFTNNDTSWHLVTMVFDGSLSGNANRLKCYLDGVQQTLSFNGTIPAVTTNTTNDFNIGYLFSASSDGMIDDVRLYDRALTPTEVMALTKSCSNPTAPRGAVQYDSDRDVMTFCDGGDWLAMGEAGDGDAGGGCANPSGGAGDMVYNTDHGVMQYCEGDEWIAISGAPDIESGLLAYWKFDESGDTALAADSANSWSGTLTNFPTDKSASWVSGQAGNALDFDGNNDHVLISSTLLSGITNQLSWGAWVKSDGDQSNWSPVFQQRANGGTENNETFSILAGDSINDEIYMGVDTADGGAWINTGENLNDHISTWIHLMAVYDGTKLVAYINGEEIARTAGTGNVPLNGNKVTIGGGANGGGDTVNEHFNGKIDDVRFYNRALSAADVKMIYESAQ